MLYQQGDVLLRSTTILPQHALPKPDGILAYGEATGHMHRLQQGSDAELYERDGVLYLRVGAGEAVIEHEEHLPIRVPAGVYTVGIVQEYDHFREEARRVID